MNLNCPKCASEDTKKLSLLMSEGGMRERGAQMGMSYGLNIAMPLAIVFIALLVSILFLGNLLIAAIVFGGIVYGGFVWRGKLKAKSKSKYDDLPSNMKQNGFQCNRCENLFIPA